jgi:hypothetical protein
MNLSIKTVATVALIYLGINLSSNIADSLKSKIVNSRIPADLIGLLSVLYAQKKDNDDELSSSLKDRALSVVRNRIERIHPDLNLDKIDLRPDKIMPMIFGDDGLLEDVILGSSGNHQSIDFDKQTEITAKFSTAIWCQLPGSIGEYQQEGSKLLVSQVTKTSDGFGDMFGFVLNGNPYKAQVGHWQIG